MNRKNRLTDVNLYRQLKLHYLDPKCLRTEKQSFEIAGRVMEQLVRNLKRRRTFLDIWLKMQVKFHRKFTPKLPLIFSYVCVHHHSKFPNTTEKNPAKHMKSASPHQISKNCKTET